MTARHMPRPPRKLALALAALLALGLTACERQPAPPATPAASAPAPAPAPRTREQAMTALLALPELAAWSKQIARDSRGQAHGAVIEDNPAPRLVNGKPYWQLSFVENRADAVRPRASFLVAHSGDDILVEDPASDKLLSLSEWRRTIKLVRVTAPD